MILRPPLRTWARVMWEAGLEETHRQASWAEPPGISAGTIFNSLRRQRPNHPAHADPLTYSTTGTVDTNKCNLFVSDLAIRSGFKACIHHIQEPLWHYIDAASYANLARNAQVHAGQPATPKPIPIRGGRSARARDRGGVRRERGFLFGRSR